MINLLPQSEKDELRLKGLKKSAMILGCSIIIGVICLALVLAVVYFYILQDSDYQMSVIGGDMPLKNDELTNTMKNYDNKLKVLHNFYENQTRISDTLLSFLEIEMPSGIYLTSLDIKKEESRSVSMSLAGFSDTRDNLLLFKDSLEKNNDNNARKITNVYFPASSWIKPNNIIFNVTFDISS